MLDEDDLQVRKEDCWVSSASPLKQGAGGLGLIMVGSILHRPSERKALNKEGLSGSCYRSSLVPLSPPRSLTGGSTQKCVTKMKLGTHCPSALRKQSCYQGSCISTHPLNWRR